MFTIVSDPETLMVPEMASPVPVELEPDVPCGAAPPAHPATDATVSEAIATATANLLSFT
jgi:hypothetical protein